MENSPGHKLPEKLVSEQKLRRRSFISFSVFAGLNIAAFGAWKWLRNSPLEKKGITGGVQEPLRAALNTNETIFRNIFSNTHLVQTYPRSRAVKDVRKNGNVGLKSEIDLQGWRLQVKKNNTETLQIRLNQLRILPKTELIFDFKCVEGWDQIQHWGGIRFSDFIKHFDLSKDVEKKYVGFETPDNEYYVGLDRESALHPQTLLAYEMNGLPLTLAHGAPLRLIVPVKYGIKHLKRIGNISFSDQRPRDYWAENGYDYYSGL